MIKIISWFIFICVSIVIPITIMIYNKMNKNQTDIKKLLPALFDVKNYIFDFEQNTMMYIGTQEKFSFEPPCSETGQYTVIACGKYLPQTLRDSLPTKQLFQYLVWVENTFNTYKQRDIQNKDLQTCQKIQNNPALDVYKNIKTYGKRAK